MKYIDISNDITTSFAASIRYPDHPTCHYMNPQVGDGVTECWYSDTKAHTVIARTKCSITIQRDFATLLNGVTSGEADALQCSAGGFCGHTHGRQRYSYERNEEGGISVYTRRSTGRWVRRSEPLYTGTKLIAGRHEHYDFNY